MEVEDNNNIIMILKWCLAVLLVAVFSRYIPLIGLMSSSDRKWFSWSKSSDSKLEEVEKKILSNLKIKYNGKYVDIGSVVGKDDKIWTIIFNENLTESIPLLIIHGLGAGSAYWVGNLEEITAGRTVYVIDFLGFGRSSRPNYSTNNKVIETQIVAALEAWRKSIGLEKFILLGHSLGGYISTLYSMQYPERIHHLILADPWGVSERPQDVGEHYNLNFFGRRILNAAALFNPLWPVRVFGPWSESLIRKGRNDIVRKLEPVVEGAHDLIPQYLYQCNSRNPSGESAFHVLMHKFAFAKVPLISRFDGLSNAIPLTILYGSRSWVDRSCIETIRNMRHGSYLNIEIMHGCGHHISLDEPNKFNKHVINACFYTEQQLKNHKHE